MKHLLRKLHIGDGLNERQKLAETDSYGVTIGSPLSFARRSGSRFGFESDVQVRFVYKRRAYSCGVWQHDHIEIIANDQGNRTMPSVVAFTDTASLIDDATKNQVAMNPRPRLAPPLLHLIQIGCSPSLSLPVA
ncbi:hypothetical protein ACFX19_007702 [Malus domestica]